MKVAIVRYNAGNTASVLNALKRSGVDATVTDDAAVLAAADKVIFPGVGEARSAMNYIRERSIDKVIKGLSQPVLGICLGMQLFCESSEEHETECLGIVPLRVRRFEPAGLKVPHMGWNRVIPADCPIFDGIPNGEHFYFVHGYYAEAGGATVAECNYGTPFTAALRKENFYGVQFHPEKSGEAGKRILDNFLNL
ncbi:MAG: imidazole glycerol phosphate synthase subunit HisH [Pyrinomonadaceae bacterium]|nr:imidazole glycerol phosphate synthase subunit HisH [Pyrinomonadaceae bacterium]